MNILLINHYAGSPEMGMEYRPWYLAREWVKAGHKVSIIAASFSHVRSVQPSTKGCISVENINGIDYYWLKTPAYTGNSIGRIRNIATYLWRLWVRAPKLSRKLQPDVVIASSTYPFDNYIARKIADLSSAAHIYEVHDLWPLSPIELGGYSPKHPFIRLLQKAEDFAYKRSDAVVSLLPATESYMKQHGLPDGRWHYIPNGIVKEEWQDVVPLAAETVNHIKGIRGRFNLLIAYTGAIGVANALEAFVRAGADARMADVAFVIVGKGPQKDSLQKLASDLGLQNIFFIGSVAKLQVADLLSHFDILYVGLQNQPLFRFGISPNKLYDYMMAAKPIIKAINAPNDPVKEADCGRSIAPGSPDEIVKAIFELRSLSDDERRAMGERARNYVLQNHDYSVLAERFLRIISEVQSSRN